MHRITNALKAVLIVNGSLIDQDCVLALGMLVASIRGCFGKNPAEVSQSNLHPDAQMIDASNDADVPDCDLLLVRQFSTLSLDDSGSHKLMEQCDRQRIPIELIYHIASFITDQSTLASMGRVNSTWHYVAMRQLYAEPRFKHVGAIDQFLKSAHDRRKRLTELCDVDAYKGVDVGMFVQQVVFEPSPYGSLSTNPEPCNMQAVNLFTPGYNELNTFHSTLFRMMVRDRGVAHPHPIVFELLEEFPLLKSVCERNVGIEFGKGECVDGNSEGLLTKLFSAAKELRGAVTSVFGVWNGIERVAWDVEGIFKVGYTDKGRGGENAFRAGMMILGRMTECMLAQIQFMTYSSQKLLDCFTMSMI